MATVLVTGANRGLGLEFVRQYLVEGWNVLATCRNPDDAEQLHELALSGGNLEVFSLDAADFDTIDALAAKLRDRPIDVLINNAGIFGPRPQADNDFRQSFGQIDYRILADVLRVNTMAPLKIAEAFIENILMSEQKKIITISSLVGSIAQGEPGLYAYRTSKAAVNMAMVTLARELEAQGVIVTLFSPGWVKTDMGGAVAAVEVEESIRRLRKLIVELKIEDSGAFINYDGCRIAW